VENRPGANASIGAQSVARSAPDEYTVLVGSGSTHVINPYCFKTLGYDTVKDFQPVTTMFLIGLVLVTNPRTVPGHSRAGLVASAKARPGQFSFASGISEDQTIPAVRLSNDGTVTSGREYFLEETLHGDPGALV
jgi:tripartite-type tricarboxylate transporter receptor subunit TctC